MKLGAVIRMADDVKPNSYDNGTKTRWINEVEGMVQTGILLRELDDVITYEYEKDAETELLATPPHDKIYWTYLVAMIDFANGEYEKYQNSMQMFETRLGEYTRWYARNFRPADEREE